MLERGWFKAVVNSVYERGEPRAPSLTTCSHAVFAVQGQTSSRWTTRTSGASSVSGASRSGWSRGTLGDKGASFGAGKITLTPHDLLRRLYMGDPAVLQLGRDSGEILIGLMMHVKPEDIPAAEEKQDFPSSLRSNEEWEIIEDEGGDGGLAC